MYRLRRIKQRSASRKPHELYLFQTRKGAIRMREASTANAKCRFDAFLRTKRFARPLFGINRSSPPRIESLPSFFFSLKSDDDKSQKRLLYTTAVTAVTRLSSARARKSSETKREERDAPGSETRRSSRVVVVVVGGVVDAANSRAKNYS